MKTSAMFWVGMTTVILIMLTVFASLAFSFSLIFLGTVIGQAMLIYTVYRVLSDNYSTDKTFDDFYQDAPDYR